MGGAPAPRVHIRNDVQDCAGTLRQVFFRLAIGPIGMIVASEPDLPWNRYGRSHGTSGAQPRCRDHGGGTGGWLATHSKVTEISLDTVWLPTGIDLVRTVLR